jgi:putative heme iron utilization protein
MSEAIALARRLMRTADRAALGVSFADAGERRAYVSLVLLAVDHDLAPILLISSLAEHSKAIASDDRISLLLDATAGHEQPLTGPRLTLLGRAEKSPEDSSLPRLRARYLARHPDAARYAEFKDFAFYRVAIERGHLVGGFGMIHWLDRAALSDDVALGETLVAAEPGIVAHMNQDHADAIDLYVNRLLGLAGSGWRMTGVDRHGIDLRLGGSVGRLDFDQPATDAATARATLVSLVKRAREMG